MTVETTTNIVSYSGNGSTTAFPVPFPFLANGDLVVTVKDANGVVSPLVLGTDYTLSGAGDDDGGVLTATVAPASGVTLFIVREMSVTQPADFPIGGPIPTAAIEQGFDRVTMLIQQVTETGSRALRVPVEDGADPDDLTIPAEAARAGRMLAFDNDGVPVASQYTSAQYDAIVTSLIASGNYLVPFSGVGDGAATSFDTGVTLGTPLRVIVSIQGLTQTGFTVSGTSVVFNEAPPDGALVYGHVLGATGEDVVLPVDDGSLTNAKLADVASQTIKGRATAGAGSPEDLTAAQARAILNVEDGADVTDAGSVAAAGAVMDSDFSTNGLMERTGAGAYSVVTVTTAGKALIDDADAAGQRTTLGLGSMATQSAGSVAITGGTATLTALVTDSVTPVSASSGVALRNKDGVAVIAAGVGSASSLNASAAGALAVTGALSAGSWSVSPTITLGGDLSGAATLAGLAGATLTATIQNGAVTYAKMQDVSAASKLLGRGDSGSGDVQEIALGSGLTMTGTTLSASGGAGSFGTQTIWVPSAAMAARPTSGASSGVYETPTHKIVRKTLDFDSATQEYAQFSVAMPKSWDEGAISFQALWTAASGSGGVAWALQAVAVGDGDVIDAAFGTAQTVTDTLISAGALHQTAKSASIVVAGSPAENDLVIFQLSRAVADAADTLAADAQFLGVRLFYTINAWNDD